MIRDGGGEGDDGGRVGVAHVDVLVLGRGQPRAALAEGASEAALEVGLRHLGLALLEAPGAG